MSSLSYVVGIVASTLTLLVVLELLRRRKLRERHAMWWLLAGIFAVIVGIFPNLLSSAAHAVGIAIPTNLVFFVSIAVLFLVCLQHSAELTALEEKTRTLAEDVALQDLRIRQLEHSLTARDGRDTASSSLAPLTIDKLIQMGTLETSSATRRSLVRWNSIWKLALVPVVALITLLAWGMSSPVSSSPDDNYHLASIWCGLGDRADLCEPSRGDSDVKLVPEAAYKATCFAYDPGQSAACLSPLYAEAGKKLIPTEDTNASGGYPPVFYAVMGVFASTDVWASTAIMRFVNSLLFTGVVGLLWFALPLRRRGTLLWSIAVSVVPLGLFIIPSTNPSSWALLSACTLWLALLGWTETTGRRRFLLGAIAFLVTVMGAGSRTDSAIFSVISIVLVGILSFRRKKMRLTGLIFPAALIAIATTLFLSASQSLVAASGLSNTTGAATESTLSLTIANFVMTPSLWLGVFGSWGLGWLDTITPAIVPVAAFGVFAAVLFTGLGQGIATRGFAWRKAVAAVLVFAALWAFPVYVLVKTGAHVGAYVQPRYILPLIILLAGILLVRERGSGPRFSSLQSLTIVGALSVANSMALFWNIRRYVTGTDVTGWNLNAGAEWWWSALPSPMIVWFIGSVAFATFLWLLCPALLPRRWPTVVPQYSEALPTA